jgi:CTP:molybdopterin cytidylyltransferase MocA
MRYVVLAAGESRRMGFDKTVRRIGALAPLERIALALGRRESVVVVQARMQATARAMMPRARVAINDAAERGMTHSLRIGLRTFAMREPFGILLGDMPAMTEATLAHTERLLDGDVDVVFPVDHRGHPGHPVLFSPRARSIVEALPDGDTLREARDDASLVRASWTCTDTSAFLDVDFPGDWRAFGA